MKKLLATLVALLLLAASCSMDSGGGDPFLPPDMGDAKDLEASGATNYPVSDEELSALASQAFQVLSEKMESAAENEEASITSSASLMKYSWKDEANTVDMKVRAEIDGSEEAGWLAIDMKGEGQFDSFNDGGALRIVDGRLVLDMALSMDDKKTIDKDHETRDIDIAFRGGYALSVNETTGAIPKGGKIIISFALKASKDDMDFEYDSTSLFGDYMPASGEMDTFFREADLSMSLYNDNNELLREVHGGLDELLDRR